MHIRRCLHVDLKIHHWCSCPETKRNNLRSRITLICCRVKTKLWVFWCAPEGCQIFGLCQSSLSKHHPLIFGLQSCKKLRSSFQPSPMISKGRLGDQGFKHQKQKTSMDMNRAKLGWLLLVVKRRCNGQCSTQLWFVEVSGSDVKPIQRSFHYLILHPWCTIWHVPSWQAVHVDWILWGIGLGDCIRHNCCVFIKFIRVRQWDSSSLTMSQRSW